MVSDLGVVSVSSRLCPRSFWSGSLLSVDILCINIKCGYRCLFSVGLLVKLRLGSSVTKTIGSVCIINILNLFVNYKHLNINILKHIHNNKRHTDNDQIHNELL